MVDQIRPSQLDAWFKQQAEPPVVLDVREPGELRTASVRPDGFELRTIPMNEVPARLAEMDPAQPVAVLCHHGARSQRVALFLAAQGFDKVVNIAGGIDAWTTERDPTVPRY
jgi:rhodanese-related sulfurtransferase